MVFNFLKKDSVLLILLQFALIAIGLYCFSFFLIGASVPGGSVYLPWLHYINYVDGLQYSIIKTCSFLLNLFGYNVTASSKSILQLDNSTSILMAYGCAGFGIMGVWIAFVITLKQPFKIMIKGLLAGLFILWTINVVRILLLILSNYHHWSHILPFDHHTNFNIVSYAAILLMLRFYMNKTELVS